MQASFGEILRSALDRKMSVRAFARAAGVSPGYVSRVIAGQRWPLPKRLRGWADLLGLSKTHRAEFILAAQLEAAPQELRDQVMKLRKSAKRTKLS